VPVGLILEEFPALGRLGSLVRDINLVRKRRISVLTAAQSLAQFDGVYPGPGETEQLLAGLATRIVFGGCDGRTAEYFSRLSSQQTVALASLSHSRRPGTGSTASLRGRALLLPDDIIRPARGQATVFAAGGEGQRAGQAIFQAELTPFFRRRDWKLGSVQPCSPLTVRRSPAPPMASPVIQEPAQAADQEQDLAAGVAEAVALGLEREISHGQTPVGRSRGPAELPDPTPDGRSPGGAARYHR